ncbi:MAG TPA: serine/threonine-protein kinase [Steroidobacteraceae bacterium]|nr:serine/threonine-protein kinase [Steroidobacteraceae bacterium]
MRAAPLDASTWERIAPYLDSALDLEPGERETWIAALTARHPDIAADLRAMLAELDALDARGFLAGSQLEGLVDTPRAGTRAGTRVGAYTLDRPIARGGMGEVWLAHRSDGRYEGLAAIKLLDATLLGRPSEQRFAREGSVLAKLRHPNIAQLIDAGVASSGQPYLVLEYVEGERIDRHVQQRGLDIEARVRLFMNVLVAVAHAHSHLIVHRDIKPSNVLVTAEGNVKLLDFGVAALLGPADAELTREADRALTPAYAAPEQLLGQPVTTATDVYALGLLLFVLLTAEHPFGQQPRSGPEHARATLERDAPRPSDLAADSRLARALRGDLDNIVAKALRKEPAARYRSAEALAEDLRRFLAHEPVSARPDSPAYRAGRFILRHRTSVAAGTVVALLLLGATAVATVQMIEAQRQRDEARRQRDVALYESQRAEFQARFASQIMSEVGGDGEPVTIRRLMEKGIEILEKNYADDPRFVIGMLVNISGRYMDLGDTSGELAALVKAEHIARRLGDPERIAYVQCNTVETELQAGRPQQAAERMRDGLANLAQVPDPPARRLVECGLANAHLLWSRGNLQEGIAAAGEVADGMAARGETTLLNYQSVTSKLERMLGEAGRWREALEWNKRAAVANEQAGRGATMSQISTRHYEAGHVYELGHPLDALAIQQSLVQQLAAQQGEQGVPASMARRLGFYQVRIHETAAGLSLLNRGVAGAAAQNNHDSHIAALLDRAATNLWLHRLEAALADVAAAEQLAAQNPSGHRNALRTARLMRSQAHLARNVPAAALEGVESLLAEIGYPRVRAANGLASMLTLKARAERALGRTDAALATANDAVVIAEQMSLQTERSALVGAALMALAETHRALGDSTAASAAARRAAATLSASLGPGHSETRAALQFR